MAGFHVASHAPGHGLDTLDFLKTLLEVISYHLLMQANYSLHALHCKQRQLLAQRRNEGGNEARKTIDRGICQLVRLKFVETATIDPPFTLESLGVELIQLLPNRAQQIRMLSQLLSLIHI